MVNKECNHMTLVIRMLVNVFLFTSSLPHCFVEVVIDVGTLLSSILLQNTQTINSNTSMCYVKCHNVNIFCTSKSNLVGKIVSC